MREGGKGKEYTVHMGIVILSHFTQNGTLISMCKTTIGSVYNKLRIAIKEMISL